MYIVQGVALRIQSSHIVFAGSESAVGQRGPTVHGVVEQSRPGLGRRLAGVSTRARVSHGAAAWGDAPSSSRCGPRRAPGQRARRRGREVGSLHGSVGCQATMETARQWATRWRTALTRHCHRAKTGHYILPYFNCTIRTSTCSLKSAAKSLAQLVGPLVWQVAVFATLCESS
jgi:hypothetical protein